MANRLNFPSAFARRLIGAGAAILAFSAVPAAAEVKAGVDAWSAGDYARAVAEWREPARAGDADALFNLAQAYRLGRGVEADISRARDLYARAAEQGHIKAADNYGLLLFQQGQQNAAMPLIKAAAERGDPRAQYVLGLAHFNADFAEKDWVRAYALLTLANGAGLPQAGPALAQMDQYVPLAQRQQAQSLARQLDEQAGQRRSAELAAADLGPPQPQVRAQVQTPSQAAPVQAPVVSRVAAVTPAPTPPAAVRATPAPAAAAAPAPAPAPARASGNWRVQLGAFGVASNAERLWTQVSRNPVLAGTRKALVPGGNVTRLQAVGFASRAEAQAACDTLKAQGQGCIVTGNS